MIDQYPSANGVLTSLIWRKTAVGGETSLSGYDNASQALSYTPGQEQVYLNGILLVRGSDYTATNGTSITGLAALAADDFVQINCYNNFSVASLPTSGLVGTISNAQLQNSSITINGSPISLGGSVSLPGDIESVTAGTGLSGGGSTGGVTLSLDTTSQYVVPSQSGQNGKYLTTDGTTSSWGTINSGGITLIADIQLNASTGYDFTSIPGTYKHLILTFSGLITTAVATNFGLRFNGDSSAIYDNYFQYQETGSAPTLFGGADTSAGDSIFGNQITNTSPQNTARGIVKIYDYASTTRTKVYESLSAHYSNNNGRINFLSGIGNFRTTNPITSLNIVRFGTSATISNQTNTSIRLYGVS